MRAMMEQWVTRLGKLSDEDKAELAAELLNDTDINTTVGRRFTKTLDELTFGELAEHIADRVAEESASD